MDIVTIHYHKSVAPIAFATEYGQSHITLREESQNVEYKESWHDKYLAWMCDYAQGGTIYFGIQDGTKKPVGVINSKKIFEDDAKNFRNPGGRVPTLESCPTYFRITLPNLIYGFNDEQLATASSVPPVATPVGKTSESLIAEIRQKPNSRLQKYRLTEKGRTFDFGALPAKGRNIH